MNAHIIPSHIAGHIVAPPSKSHTHRALFCSLLAEGTSTVRSMLESDDTTATRRLCESLGAEITDTGGALAIQGHGAVHAPAHEITCGGSASTLRMGMAIAALGDGPITLTGTASLLTRPIGPLAKALDVLGATCHMPLRTGYPPVTITGPLRGGKTTLPGSESSQYLSALLLACPLGTTDTSIVLSSPLESRPYVDMTIASMAQFGVAVDADTDYATIEIPGGQSYRPASVDIEGDYSSAAFMLAAGALAGAVTVDNLSETSPQGDRRIIDILEDFGADVTRAGTAVSVSRAPLTAITIDCSDIPDLVPILAVLASQATGVTVLRNIGRLRIKESNRIATITEELSNMGACIKSNETAMSIRGPTPLTGTSICPHDDHRIAMACAVAALVSERGTTITDVECMEKSYPSFLSDLSAIGGGVSVQ